MHRRRQSQSLPEPPVFLHTPSALRTFVGLSSCYVGSHRRPRRRQGPGGSTVRRAESLWWYASWELQDDIVSVWSVWDQTISALIHQHALMKNLSTSHRSKHYFSIPQLYLLFEALLLRLRKLRWWKQNYLAWALSLMCGIQYGG